MFSAMYLLKKRGRLPKPRRLRKSGGYAAFLVLAASLAFTACAKQATPTPDAAATRAARAPVAASVMVGVAVVTSVPAANATSTLIPLQVSVSPAGLTPQPTVTAQVTTDKLNMRSGPGTNYPQQAQLHKGDDLAVLERTDDQDWIHIRTADGMDGWVAAKFTDVGSAVQEVPVARSIPPTPKVVARK